MFDYSLIFLAGLLSTAHCVGMCGMIVLAYSSQHARGETFWMKKEWLVHLAYNVGRIFSYALLGALVGYAGLSLSMVQGAASVISIVGGIAMILAGLAMLGVLPVPVALSPGGSSLALKKFRARLLLAPSIPSKLSLGLLTPLLPCGVLYAMIGKAANAGGAAEGALTMAVFGAGMAPGLLALGSLSSLLSVKMRRGAEIVAAVTIVLMGVILVLRGLHVPFLSFIPLGMQEHHSCCSQ
jgi:uncharacterized protein